MASKNWEKFKRRQQRDAASTWAIFAEQTVSPSESYELDR